MKHLVKIIFAASILLSFAIAGNAQKVTKMSTAQAEMLSPFPKAASGMVRHVIFLEKKSDESLLKVEVIPGKVMNVDCNHHSLMGKLEEKDLQGWGYTYFEFTSNGQTRSTMKACNTPNQDRFIYGQTQLVRYNSKLPIVVYAPKGFDVKYKIWKAGKEMNATKQ